MIYLDHAATTPVDPQVLEAMIPYFSQFFGNASNVYSLSLAARRALDQARGTIAACLNAKPQEIYFTGCGTESDNLALMGMARTRLHQGAGHHVITGATEHPAVLSACAQLEREGCKISRLLPDEYGMVTPEQVVKALTPQTSVISLMMANNEIGTLNPIGEIVRAVRATAKGNDIFIHCDAVQAAGSIPIDVAALGVDALSISAHKFYGPKGVGALFLRTGAKPCPINFGGGQESGLRSGTENVAGIVGMGKALELACARMDEDVPKIKAMRDTLISELTAKIEHCRLTGHPALRLPGSASFLISDIEGESLLMQLDRQGICASAGSACSAGGKGGSHVLKALGLTAAQAKGSLRLTLGRLNKPEDLPTTVEAIVKSVAKLRLISGIRRGGKH